MHTFKDVFRRHAQLELLRPGVLGEHLRHVLAQLVAGGNDRTGLACLDRAGRHEKIDEGAGDDRLVLV